MNSTASEQLRCAVQGEDKLPPEIGGAEAICTAIRRAAAQQPPTAARSVSVTVHVQSAYTITAVATVGARSLPEQRVDISDRPLNQRSIDMLTQAVAAQLSKAAQE